ncbi:helix-turn-helix domain-containing protein [Bradyrhizobium canariense]|uniref:helix-turn-helix domain-containing protein n=1 Tax=Bradyrhizobium canariense TaxID=255045 RepID=UPI0011BAA188|nr:helix-turn-helix domain-containing protein [Bradyrhizobium canariense]
MERRSVKLTVQEGTSKGRKNRDVIQVLLRAFNILRCFEARNMRLGNSEIADRCGLPRSTVSRLLLTLTEIGQLVYFPQEQKYAPGSNAIVLGASFVAENKNRPDSAEEQELQNECIPRYGRPPAGALDQ